MSKSKNAFFEPGHDGCGNRRVSPVDASIAQTGRRIHPTPAGIFGIKSRGKLRPDGGESWLTGADTGARVTKHYPSAGQEKP